MKILKKIGIGLLALIALVLIIGLFVKKEYGVEREIVINKPKTEVFNYIKFLKNQDNYSVWSRMDPAMEKSFTGTDGSVGAVASWKSKMDNVGEGEQEIKKIDEGNRIDFELRFKVPFEATDNAYMITEEVSPTQTKVKWGFNGKMNYPMNLMLLCMDMEGMLGNDLAKGLSDLKVILEK
jgi:hypothetical protein